MPEMLEFFSVMAGVVGIPMLVVFLLVHNDDAVLQQALPEERP